MASKTKTLQRLQNDGSDSIEVLIARLLCAGAFGFSMLLSLYGIAISLDALQLSPIVRYVAALCGTALLIGLAYLSWRRVGVTILRLARGVRIWYGVGSFAFFGMIGLVVTTLSIITSFSATVFVLQGDTVQAELRAIQTAEVARPINAFAAAQLQVSQMATSVQVAAKEASDRERAEGGSCGPTLPGKGPITDLRKKHSDEASNLATASRAMAAEADALADRLIQATTQAEVNAVYRAAQRLLADPRLGALRSWSESTQIGLMGTPFNFQGGQHLCIDTDMAEDLAVLHAAASAVPELPQQKDVPQIREATIFDSMALTVGKITRLLGEEQATPNDWSVLPYLIFSILLDGIGLVSAVALAIRSADRLTAEERSDYVRTSWAIRHLVWPFQDGKSYLLVPIAGHADKEDLARNMVAKLGLSPRPMRFRIPLAILRRDVPDLPDYFAAMNGNPSHVDIFLVDRKTEERMNTLHTEAILALEYDAREYKDYPSQVESHENVHELSLVG